jgi:diacylglycerol O-acyltransferase
MDRPTNLMVINSVMLFDEPLDVERVKHVCRRRLIGRYPRFRERVVEARVPLRPPSWEDDPDFELEHHVHHLALPAPGDKRALRELISELIVMPLDRNRPLWQVYVVDGFEDGAAMITRMHHCIADGIALAQVMLSLTDSDPDPSRRVTWSSPLSLAQIKHVAHVHGATVNDVLLAAVSGALRHYLQDQDSSVAEIQAMVPFNLRDLNQPLPHELGNKFGLVFLPLPVATSGSYRRLVQVHRRMQEIKHGRDGAVSYGMLSLLGLTPEPIERRIVDMLSAKGTAVLTNVPGPSDPVYLAGSPIRTVLVWAPTSGHIGMSVSIFSYRGEVTVGLMVDAALIPEPNRIVAQLEQELTALSGLHPQSRRKPARRHRQPKSAVSTR